MKRRGHGFGVPELMTVFGGWGFGLKGLGFGLRCEGLWRGLFVCGFRDLVS